MLVAVTLLVVVGAALNTMLVGQFRMFSRVQGATRMQRDLRTGLAVLPQDLRGAARASLTVADLTALTDSSIYLRATIGSSVVCARSGTTAIDVPPLNLARNTLTAWYTQPLVGDTVLLYNDSTRAGAEDDVWTPRTITAVASGVASTGCAGAPYTDPVADAGKPRWRFTLGTTAGVAIPDGVAAGAPVRFLRSVRYSLFQPTPSTSQWYLGYRELVGNAWTAAQPIAGPFERYARGTGSGVRFTYFDTLGLAIGPSPMGTQVGRVDLVLRTRALLRAGTRDSLVLRDSLAARIALRNRI
jgi:hypothetical protein